MNRREKCITDGLINGPTNGHVWIYRTPFNKLGGPVIKFTTGRSRKWSYKPYAALPSVIK